MALGNAHAAPVSPFEALAARYDATFTSTPLGLRLRHAVWRHLDDRFFEESDAPRLLDLGCGTGEDAVHLAQQGAHVLALDAAEAMTARTRRKAKQSGVGPRVAARTLSVERLDSLSGTFDGAYSNFGALNCVEDLRSVSTGLAPRLRPKAPVFLVLMGRLCPWEWVHFLARGEPRKAFRRLARGGTEWRGLTVRYPSVRTVKRAFARDFRFVKARAVGAFLPPSYLEPWAARHADLIALLDGWERRLEGVWPLPHLADHVLLEFRRR